MGLKKLGKHRNFQSVNWLLVFVEQSPHLPTGGRACRGLNLSVLFDILSICLSGGMVDTQA